MKMIISTILKNYKELSLQKKAVLWFTFATVIQNGILFIVTPLYTRLLSSSEYGIFSVYQSWQQIFSIVCIIALDRCISIGFVKFSNDKDNFLSSVQFLMLFISLLFIVVVLVFNSFFTNFIGLPLSIIVIMIFVSLANGTFANWCWLQRYKLNYILLTVITVLCTFFIQFVGVLSVAFLGFSNKGYMMIFSTAIVRCFLYGFIFILVFIRGKKMLNKMYFVFSLKYSISIVPHALSQIILNSSDRIMIDKICGKASAAFYGVTYSCAYVLNVIFQSVSSSIQPWFFQQIKEKKYNEIASKTNTILLFSALFSIFVCLIAPEIISIMAPSSYSNAIFVFPSIVGGVFFNSMYFYFANFESYFEKPHFFSLATSFGAIINIVLNSILIPIFGFIAAGYTTLISYIFFSIFHYIFMSKICKDNFIPSSVFDKKFLGFLSIVFVIIIIFLPYLYNFLYLRYSLILSFFIIFAFVFFLKNAKK